MLPMRAVLEKMKTKHIFFEISDLELVRFYAESIYRQQLC